MEQNALQDFRRFSGINEAWELERTGLLVVREQLYRLELWHSYSNADVPYYVAVYVQENGVWRKMPGRPFAVAPDGDQALRIAMDFLVKDQAA